MTPLVWDVALFRAIHLGLHHPALDPVMKAFTDPEGWKIPILVAFGGLFLTRRLRGLLAVLVLAATLTVSDQVSSKVIKPLLKRPRPSVELADARPLFGVRRSYAFPSGHATNASAIAPIFAAVFPPAAVVAYGVVAGLVCFSRVYVGDHWPSDVLGGIALGLAIGFLGRAAFLRLAATISRARAGRPEEAGGVPSAGR